MRDENAEYESCLCWFVFSSRLAILYWIKDDCVWLIETDDDDDDDDDDDEDDDFDEIFE